jgi:hypothetical protein
MFNDKSNIFDDLFFSRNAPFHLVVAAFIYTVFVVIPVTIRNQLMAKYFIYIGGMCEIPCNYFSGIMMPWIIGMMVNHLQIFVYLVDWTTLGTCIYVSFVCPMFMWSKSVKEAKIYENNFK